MTTRMATGRRSSPATGAAARQFQFDVNAGMVGVNVPIPVPVAYYSFGGWKASLFGDLHMYGPDGIQSTPGPRSSPSAGQTREPQRSTWASRGRADRTRPGGLTEEASMTTVVGQ